MTVFPDGIDTIYRNMKTIILLSLAQYGRSLRLEQVVLARNWCKVTQRSEVAHLSIRLGKINARPALAQV